MNIIKKKVVLDAGHGGKDSGALGPNGKRESDVALSVVLLLGAMLIDAGIEVIFTRKSDIFISLAERCAIANRANADAFLSIHCNSAEPGKGEGFEVFTSPGQTDSDVLATSLFLYYKGDFPDRPGRADLSDSDEDKEAKFAVLTGTEMCAALFELEFINTSTGEKLLCDPAYQAKAAKSLRNGVMRYFGQASLATGQLPALAQAAVPPVAVVPPAATPPVSTGEPEPTPRTSISRKEEIISLAKQILTLASGLS